MNADDLCVVHLVRARNGLEPLHTFLDTYRRHEAGIDHELVLLLKGFGDEAAAADHVRAARDLHPRTIHVSDAGFDLDAYATAAQRLNRTRYCFLNSFSRVLADRWLASLAAAHAEGAGLVGASGSWASMLSYSLFHLGLPSAYRATLGPRTEAIAQFEALDHDRTGARFTGGPRQRLGRLRVLLDMSVGFERFPAPHVRTNAFLIGHEMLGELVLADARRKVDAHRLESGRRSITRQVQALGRRAVVVNRAARAYEWPDWPASETFWRGDQAGLLVADGQTDDYMRADPRRRRLLSSFAWGEHGS
jgi:hypothetical protein